MSAVDLNLLRVFDALLEEQSVTRAGSRLGLTQSAVSHALTRLRHHFSDPLFVRGPAGMTPTARALEVGPGVHAALSQLQNALLPARFDAATAERRFTIAAGSYGCAIVVPPLVARLAERAPGVDLMVVLPGPDIAERLDSRRADFAFWIDEPTPERISGTPVLEESLVWAVRVDHPSPPGPMSIEDLAALSHVIISQQRGLSEARPTAVSDSTWQGLRPFEAVLAERGLKQRIGVTVPDIYSAIAVAAGSDMATLIPRRLGLMSEKMGILRLIDPPHDTPAVKMSVLALKERLAEPALAWMRDLLIEVGAEV